MGTMSRNKGKRGELELAKALTELLGIDVKRGRQYKGSPESPDVYGLDGIHVECKRVERFNIYDSIEQAENDSGDNIPVVIYRKNRNEWLVIHKLTDWKKVSEVINEIATKRR